jgi:hypothetical protein
MRDLAGALRTLEPRDRAIDAAEPDLRRERLELEDDEAAAAMNDRVEPRAAVSTADDGVRVFEASAREQVAQLLVGRLRERGGERGPEHALGRDPEHVHDIRARGDDREIVLVDGE